MSKIIRAVDQDYKIIVGPSGSITLSGRTVNIDGDLVITGTTTTVTTADLIVKDNLIVLNSGETSAGVSLGVAGIQIDRGTLPTVQLVFNEATDKFELGFVDGSVAAINVGDVDSSILSLRTSADPASELDKTKVWSKDIGQGGTGLYFVNTTNSADELISRRKALAYSIIF